MDNNELASALGRFFRYGLCFSAGKEMPSDSISDRVALSDRYNLDSDFQMAVDIFLSQLGLEVVDTLEDGILFVTEDSSADDNIFRSSMSDFRRSGEKNAHILTAVLVAILCAVYRASDEVHSSERVLYLTEMDARRIVVKTARELAEEEGADETAADTLLRPAWRDILAMEEESFGQRTTTSSIQGCVYLALQTLQNQKLLKQAPKEAEGEYIITRRFAAQVKDIFVKGRLQKLLDELRISDV